MGRKNAGIFEIGNSLSLSLSLAIFQSSTRLEDSHSPKFPVEKFDIISVESRTTYEYRYTSEYEILSSMKKYHIN